MQQIVFLKEAFMPIEPTLKKSENIDPDYKEIVKKYVYDLQLTKSYEEKSTLKKTSLLAPEQHAIKSNLPTPIIEAVRKCKDAKDQRLIKSWIDGTQNKDATDEYGNTLLHHAADQPSIGLVKWLIKNGLSIDALNLNGESPLLIAIRQAAVHKSFYTQKQPDTSLFIKDREKFIAVVRIFIENKAALSMQGGVLNTPKTALRTALFLQDIDLMRILITEAKADVNQITKDQTPLMSAIFNPKHSLTVIKFLVLDAKADIHKITYGPTPLDIAKLLKKTEVAEFLQQVMGINAEISPTITRPSYP